MSIWELWALSDPDYLFDKQLPITTLKPKGHMVSLCVSVYIYIPNILFIPRESIGDQNVTVAVTPNGYADAVCGDRFVMPEERTMTFSEFLDILYKEQDANGIFYVQKQNSNFTEEFNSLMKDASADIDWATEAFGEYSLHYNQLNMFIIWTGNFSGNNVYIKCTMLVILMKLIINELKEVHQTQLIFGLVMRGQSLHVSFLELSLFVEFCLLHYRYLQHTVT